MPNKKVSRKKTEAEEQVAYGSIEPNFPRDAFIIVLILLFNNEKNSNGILPLSSVFTAPSDVKPAIEEILEMTEERNMVVPEEALLFPIKLAEFFPLKPEYWHNPQMEYDTWERLKLFVPLVQNPSLYHMLVTPRLIEEDNHTLFDAALPIKNPSDTKLIERFMLTSDLPVDERATNAAIYKVNKPMLFNWQTNEISPLRPEVTRE